MGFHELAVCEKQYLKRTEGVGGKPTANHLSMNKLKIQRLEERWKQRLDLKFEMCESPSTYVEIATIYRLNRKLLKLDQGR